MEPLKVGIFHRPEKGNEHCEAHRFEIAVGTEEGLRSNYGKEGFTLRGVHDFSELNPAQRRSLEDFHGGARTKPGGHVRCGYMNAVCVRLSDRCKLAVFNDYFPKDDLPRERNGLGAVFEDWCLEHLQNREKVTHVATARYLDGLADEEPGLKKKAGRLLNSLKTNQERIDQLEKRGTDTARPHLIRQWRKNLRNQV
ncbi:MAG: hypothetical protein WCX64_03695 [Candidatus Micrarchaeia archaeon]